MVPDAGRPRQRADARRNRARLLEAAEEVFAAEGHAVHVDEIARRAGVGVGTFYRHFPTKEALFEAIVVDHLERLVGEGWACCEAAEPGEAFFGFLERLVEEGSKKRDLADTLTGFGVDIEVTAPDLLAELRRAVTALLERAQEAGSVRRDVIAADVIGLVSCTCMAVEGCRPEGSSPGRILAVVLDGLRRTDCGSPRAGPTSAGT